MKKETKLMRDLYKKLMIFGMILLLEENLRRPKNKKIFKLRQNNNKTCTKMPNKEIVIRLVILQRKFLLR